jgi:molybdopterin converting factor small subunit
MTAFQGGRVSVEVRIPTLLRKFTDQRATVEVPPGSVADVIRELESKFPGLQGQLVGDDGELHRFVNVYVNDEDVRYLDRLDTKAADGDTVSLLPSVAGGARIKSL